MWANRDCLQNNSPIATDTCTEQAIDKEQFSTKTDQEEIHSEPDICSQKISITNNTMNGDDSLQCEGTSHSSKKQYSTRLQRILLKKNHLSCAICSKKFSEKDDLTSHMENHTGPLSFRCEICKKRFVSCKNLQNHMQMHAGDTPYSCDMCPMQFSHKSYLNSHKLTHVTNKHHDCDVCGKQFLSKYQLNSHKQSHALENPYTCKYCKKEFTSNSYFIKHIWTCKK